MRPLLLVVLGATACKGEPEIPCPPYTALSDHRGDSWSWQSRSGESEQYTWDVELGRDGDLWVLTTDQELVSGSADARTITRVEHYLCDTEGAWLQWSRQDVSETVGGTTTESFEERDYDQPVRVMPYGVEPGDSWSINGHYTGETDEGPIADGVHLDLYTSVSYSITVPAGTFQALEFSSWDDDIGETQTWYCDIGVGPVQTNDGELVAYEIADYPTD